MSRVPSQRLVAYGTWHARSMRAPIPNAKDFAPVSTAPAGSMGDDLAIARYEYDRDSQRGVPARASLTRQAALHVAAWAKERSRKSPKWRVSEAASATELFRRKVATYCLGHKQWGPAVEAMLTRTTPELAGPLAELESARSELRAGRVFTSEAAATALTDRALAAAAETSTLVRAHYRAVPAKVHLPWVGLELAGDRRARALGEVVQRYDSIVAGWYGFVFTSPPPDDRAAQLADLSDELDIAEAVAACEQHREQCRELAALGALTRPVARAAVADLRRAVAGFEEAVFRAAAG